MNKSIFKLSIILFLSFMVFSCSDDEEVTPNGMTETTAPEPTGTEDFLDHCTVSELPALTDEFDSGDWVVPQNEVFDGGPGQDGIPSVDNPQFSKATDINFLRGEDLVLGIQVGKTIKAYPHPVLDWHEIVNDAIESEAIALTYCPLTGTGIGWDRELNDTLLTTFGVSGLLYNTNLIPFDRTSGSRWSQQQLVCVNGDLITSRPEIHSFVETTWSTWLAAYPDSDVLNSNTGFNRNYGQYPYGDYITNNNFLLFPISNNDTRLPAKERVLGVLINDEEKAFTFNDGAGSEMVVDNLGGDVVTVVRNNERQFIVAFLGNNFRLLDDSEFPYILEDPNGAKYDILGYSDTADVEPLCKPHQFIGYWFSWGTFYPDIDLD